jgi:hypothetical protein
MRLPTSCRVARPRGVLPRGAAAAALAVVLLVGGGCDTRHVLGVLPLDGGAGVGGAGGTGAPGPAAAPPCGPFVPGHDLAVCASSFLGGGAGESAPSVVVGAGALVVGLTTDADLGVTPRVLLGGGAGAVLRLRYDGRQALSLTRLGETVRALAVEPGRGRLAALGAPFGLAVLGPDAGQVLWQRPVAGTRVAFGADGTVAVLDAARAEVTLFGADGAPQGTIDLRADGRFDPTQAAGLQAADVAVHGSSRTVVVTGSTPAGTTRQPFLFAYGYDGQARWRNYGWKEGEPGADRASTRGVRVTIGLDDRLYYAGESNGGNTTHGHHPRRLGEEAATAKGDEFHIPYNTATTVLFVGRFRPDDGAFELGQFLLARDPPTANGRGDAVSALAIAADEGGRVLVGGRMNCCTKDAARKAIRGTSVMPGPGDAFVVLWAPELRTRHVWTTFSRGGPAETTGVALSRGVAVMVAAQERAAAAAGGLVTHEALQARPGPAAVQNYFAVWSAPE